MAPFSVAPPFPGKIRMFFRSTKRNVFLACSRWGILPIDHLCSRFYSSRREQNFLRRKKWKNWVQSTEKKLQNLPKPIVHREKLLGMTRKYPKCSKGLLFLESNTNFAEAASSSRTDSPATSPTVSSASEWLSLIICSWKTSFQKNQWKLLNFVCFWKQVLTFSSGCHVIFVYRSNCVSCTNWSDSPHLQQNQTSSRIGHVTPSQSKLFLQTKLAFYSFCSAVKRASVNYDSTILTRNKTVILTSKQYPRLEIFGKFSSDLAALLSVHS